MAGWVQDDLEATLRTAIAYGRKKWGDAKVEKILHDMWGEHYAEIMRELYGQVTPTPIPSTGFPCTTFLRDGGKKTSHVLMSRKISDAQRVELISYLAKQRYNRIYIYLENRGDYGGRSVTWNPAEVAWWRQWLSVCIQNGLGPVIWMSADDSAELNAWSNKDWQSKVSSFQAQCGDLVHAYCTGLECNERWSAGRTQELTKMIQGETGKKVGVHTTGLKSIGHAKGADWFGLQTGFNKSVKEVVSQVKSAIAQFDGDVYLEEYSLFDNEAGKALGDAGLAAGAKGVGNGCHVR